MPIPSDTAEVLIRRLKDMRKYPAEWSPLERQMILTLAESARDAEHGASLVSRLMESLLYAPMPCQIRDLALADAAQVQAFDPQESVCPLCGGTGWAPAWELLTWTDPAHKRTERISCERYQELRSGPRREGLLVQEVVRRCPECKKRKVGQA